MNFEGQHEFCATTTHHPPHFLERGKSGLLISTRTFFVKVLPWVKFLQKKTTFAVTFAKEPLAWCVNFFFLNDTFGIKLSMEGDIATISSTSVLYRKKKIHSEILFFLLSPQTKENTPKIRGDLFSFFEIFTAEFLKSLFGDKKTFFVTKKWLNSAVKISKKWTKFSPFWGIFLSVWGTIKNKFLFVYTTVLFWFINIYGINTNIVLYILRKYRMLISFRIQRFQIKITTWLGEPKAQIYRGEVGCVYNLRLSEG